MLPISKNSKPRRRPIINYIASLWRLTAATVFSSAGLEQNSLNLLPQDSMKELCKRAKAILLLLCTVCAASASTIHIKYSLNPDRATLGEPVSARIVITNNFPEAAIADFGFEGTQNLAIEVTRPDGQRVAFHPCLKEGFTEVGIVKIGSGQDYTRDILLSDLLRFDLPGNYEISIRLIKPILGGAQAALLDQGATLDLTLEPRDEVRLEARCAELAQQLSETVTAEGAQSAAKALSTINDPVAVPYLRQAAISAWQVDWITIPALGRIGDATAADALIELLHAKASDTTHLAGSALTRIENTTSDVQLRNRINRSCREHCPRAKCIRKGNPVRWRGLKEVDSVPRVPKSLLSVL